MKSWNLQSFIMSKKNHCPIVWRFQDFILVLSTMQILKSNEKGVSLETCQFSMIHPLHPWMDPPLRTEKKDANARNIIISDFGQVYPLTDLTSFQWYALFVCL
jgi:hypothetical protein